MEGEEVRREQGRGPVGREEENDGGEEEGGGEKVGEWQGHEEEACKSWKPKEDSTDEEHEEEEDPLLE
jgi:hypothetical protein